MIHRVRNYSSEGAAASLEAVPAEKHPLLPSPDGVIPTSAPTGGSGIAAGVQNQAAKAAEKPAQAFSDPLQAFAAQKDVDDDPLGASSKTVGKAVDNTPIGVTTKIEIAEARQQKGVPSHAMFEDASVSEDWDAKKTQVLSRFAAQGTITVSTTFDVVGRAKRGLSRLQQLEDSEKAVREETMIVSQHEFVLQLREMNEDIAQAWLGAERVTALKLATKVARLLTDTSVPGFYPTLFVLVTEVMDTVGRLVFDRIRNKAEREDDGTFVCVLPKDFTARDVRQDAKDTCVNWFYKIGAIRDLLPRLYMEMAILKCYHFLQVEPPRAQIQRLARMMRGLGDPLAAAYARCYLARRGAALLPGEKGYLAEMLGDMVPQYTGIGRAVPFTSAGQPSHLSAAEYLQLVDPALEWVLSRLCDRADTSVLQTAIGAAGSQPPLSFLKAVLWSLPATFASANALRLAELTRLGCDPIGAESRALAQAQALQAACYRRLGEKLIELAPSDSAKLPLLREVWRVVTHFTALQEYLSVADIWVEFTLRHFGAAELDALCGDIRRHVGADAVPPGPCSEQLTSVVSRVLVHHDLFAAMRLQNFVPLLDCLSTGSSDLLEIMRRVLTSVTSPGAAKLTDPVAIHFAFEAAKAVHDSLDPFSPEGDRKDLQRLVAKFVRQVDFGRDLEQHLQFLVDCRKAFCNMTGVQEQLVHVSNRLAMEALRLVKGKHSPRTAAFVKACVAYNQITVPSLSGVLRRLPLFLSSARVALANRLLPHTDALIRSAITDMAESSGPTAVYGWADLPPAEAEEGMVNACRSLAGILVVVPGHPERGPFFLISGLLKAIEEFPWQAGGDGQARALLGIMPLAAALSQQQLPYHVPGVESNDVLYAADTGYRDELTAQTHQIVQKVAALVGGVDQPGSDGARKRAYRKVDLLNQLLICCKATKEIKMLAEELLTRAQAVTGDGDPYVRSTRRHATAVFKRAAAAAEDDAGAMAEE